MYCPNCYAPAELHRDNFKDPEYWDCGESCGWSWFQSPGLKSLPDAPERYMRSEQIQILYLRGDLPMSDDTTTKTRAQKARQAALDFWLTNSPVSLEKVYAKVDKAVVTGQLNTWVNMKDVNYNVRKQVADGIIKALKSEGFTASYDSGTGDYGRSDDSDPGINVSW